MLGIGWLTTAVASTGRVPVAETAVAVVEAEDGACRARLRYLDSPFRRNTTLAVLTPETCDRSTENVVVTVEWSGLQVQAWRLVTRTAAGHWLFELARTRPGLGEIAIVKVDVGGPFGPVDCPPDRLTSPRPDEGDAAGTTTVTSTCYQGPVRSITRAGRDENLAVREEVVPFRDAPPALRHEVARAWADAVPEHRRRAERLAAKAAPDG